MTSLSLQEVDYYEPSNFYIGPRAVISAFNDRLANRFLIVGLLFFHPLQADLIHLGAKYSPCMKPDTRIGADIEATRIRERQTACCIRNDNSGCVQTSRAECSVKTVSCLSFAKKKKGGGGTNFMC